MIDSNDRPSDIPTGDSGNQPGIPGVGDGGMKDPAGEDAPVNDRNDRNPGNLGDDVAEEGDVVFPFPEPSPAQI